MTMNPDVQLVSNEPLYNIGVVSRMTGISMATLRAWERRYDFPESHRTAGGHRLYSEVDITRLRWVKHRVDEGMQTAQSINALRHHEQTGHNVLTEQLLPSASQAAARPVSLIDAGQQDEHKSYLGLIQDRLMEALYQRKLNECDDIISEAMAVVSPDELILGGIAPILAKTGHFWETGKISVATEHLATNYLRQRLLVWMVSGPPSLPGQPILLACGPDEWHEGSLLIMGSLLRRRRWPVAYLGQAVPLDELSVFVGDIKPSLVVLVAMTEKTANYLVDWPRSLPEVFKSGKPIIGYSGRIFVERPEWRLKVPGIFLGSTFEEGISTIERLILPT